METTTNNMTTLAAAPSSQPRNLTQASRQWATRPDDERFTSLLEMQRHFAARRATSVERVVSTRDLYAQPLINGDLENEDGRGLVIVSERSGQAVAPTNWAFSQLAQRAKAPVSYMKELPAPLAADCINYGLRFANRAESAGVLLHKEGNFAELQAVTGPNYGRVWNADVINGLVKRFGDGVTGDWRVPGEFGRAVQVTKANTTLYASDRDMFVFLADETNRIELSNRRDGAPGSLARGFFVWNSEVGKTSYGMAMFLFDYVCMNRIVWGAEQYHEIRGRHTAAAPDRWLEEVMPAIRTFADASEKPVIAAIEAARSHKLNDVQEFLKNRFTDTKALAIMAVHQHEENRPIETLWDAATAITAYARELPHQDARVEMERQAGKLLRAA